MAFPWHINEGLPPPENDHMTDWKIMNESMYEAY